MTKIAITALYPDSSPFGNGQVTIRLVDAGSGGAVDGGTVVAPFTKRLDANGETEVDLTPTEDVDPAGTFYAITVRSSPTVVRYIEVPQPNGTGDDEIPYAWDDPTIQRLVPDPPQSIPAAASGDVADVLTVVDEGDGKKWKAQPPTGGGGSGADSDVTITGGSVPALSSATAVAAWEAAAAAQGVSTVRIDEYAAILPYVVTEAGTSQLQVNKNLGQLAPFTLARAGLAHDAADEAERVAVVRDALTSYGLTATPPAAFARCGTGEGIPGITSERGHWECATVLDPPTTSLRVRAWRRTVRSPFPTNPNSQYQEDHTVSLDGTGALDAIEIATSFGVQLGPEAFYEKTAVGGTEEDVRIHTDGLPVGVWGEIEVLHVLSTNVVTVRARCDLGDYQDPDDDTIWLTLAVRDFGSATTIEATAYTAMWIGYGGGLFDEARVRRWDDGTLVMDADFTGATEGDVSIDDAVLEASPGVAAEWVAEDQADVGETPASGGGALSDDNPLAPGTPAPGTSDEGSRSDHVHPLETADQHATTTHAATGKTTPVDADEIALVDSAASYVGKKLTMANLWVWVKAKLATIGIVARTAYSLGSLTGTIGIDLANGPSQYGTLTGNTTFTMTGWATSGLESELTVEITQDSTPRTVTWPAAVKWPGGVTPAVSTASGAVDVFVFRTRNGGTTIHGFLPGRGMA